jgi:beta-glucosidase
MRRSHLRITTMLATFTLFLLTGCSPLYKDPNAPIEDRINDLLPRMSLCEKFEQMAGNASILDLLAEYSSKVYTTPENPRLGIPGLKFTDGPRGVMLNNSTCFPVSMARGATWDPELEERVGEAMGLEARAQEANMYGSPCINVLRHPGWGRAQETYGADPFHLGIMGSALTRGLQENVMACAKHFTANSIENTRFVVDVQMDERTLREVYLPQFRMTVDEGIASVMSAYNKLNGAYCSQNAALLRGILKGEWGFSGFVISDFWLGMHGVDSVNAGLDIEMPMAFFYSGPALLLSVLSGEVLESNIDEAVRGILRQKFRFGLFDGREPTDPSVVASPEHRALAREVAQEGIVLLKNENEALPLSEGSLERIAVIGHLADEENLGDTGSSNVKPPYVVTPLEGILARVGDSVIVDYYGGNDLNLVRAYAARADAVIVVTGLTVEDEGEFIPVISTSGGDREQLGLGEEREGLITAASSANARTVVVLEGGSAITMESWADGAEAILMAWYPGMEGGNALAAILFGDVNPSGKLPLTFPRSDGQLYDPGFDAESIVYEYDHDYRYVDRQGLEPLFPFGHGLSYSTFAFGNLRLDEVAVPVDETITVRVDITNTGGVSGEEVVQLYISYPESLVLRPIKELKGFSKVALDPGETKTVTIEVEPENLAYYNPATGNWEIEHVQYEVNAGASSRDIRLGTTLQIIPSNQGKAADLPRTGTRWASR